MRPASDAERRALGVPPAYSNVMISEDPTADLRATAKTPKGKTFYLYSKEFRAKQDAKKYRRVEKLAGKAAKVQERIERDASDLRSRDFHVAHTARLILLTGLRNGGKPQGEKESFGASSLLMSHVTVVGSDVVLEFPGKHGVMQRHRVSDSLFLGYVQMRSGQRTLFPHNAGHTLRYLKRVGVQKVHDLRTLRANMLAQALTEQLLKIDAPETKKEIKAFQKAVATKVSETLGNKPGQALKSYINPGVWDGLEKP